MRGSRKLHATFAATTMMIAGCGYHVAGHDTALPKCIHVIAVAAMQNQTTSFRIEQKLTTATVYEFLTKTAY